MIKSKKCIKVVVLRNPYNDEYFSGVTAKYNSFYLFKENTSLEDIRNFCVKKFDRTGTIVTYNECLILQTNSSGERIALPYYVVESKQKSIFGGNFIYTESPNFKNISGSNTPIPVHDYIIKK